MCDLAFACNMLCRIFSQDSIRLEGGFDISHEVLKIGNRFFWSYIFSYAMDFFMSRSAVIRASLCEGLIISAASNLWNASPCWSISGWPSKSSRIPTSSDFKTLAPGTESTRGDLAVYLSFHRSFQPACPPQAYRL
jgi:hypothetical protein